MDEFRELLPVLCGLPKGAKLKTDEEINAIGYTEWLEVIQSLWVAIGKPVDQKRLKIYARAFSAVPLGLLEKAIQRVQLTVTYNIVPTIAEIHKALQVELHEAKCITYQDWCHRVWTTHPEAGSQ